MNNITEFFKIPKQIINKARILNDFIKNKYPWVDSGCNDCKYFKFNGKWGYWGGRIRYGTCQRSRLKKFLLYLPHLKELRQLILAENQHKGLRRYLWLGKKVIAIPNYCVNMRCFKWRKE